MMTVQDGTNDEWSLHKEEIKSLFLTQGMTRDQTMKVMKERHNFDKTFGQPPIHFSVMLTEATTAKLSTFVD